VKLGGEIQYNYYGLDDVSESILILLRVHPNISIQLNPGYLQSSTVASWMFSVGVSVSTASVELTSSDNAMNKKTNVPSFDDLEKQIREEKKKE